MKLDLNRILNFIAFATLLMLAFNVSTAFGHGYHYDDDIQVRRSLVKKDFKPQINNKHNH